MADGQLFAVDAAPDEAAGDEGAAGEGLAEDTTELARPAPAAVPRGERRPVWTDEDDERIQVHLAGRGARAADGSVRGTKRLRKLRANPDETSVSGAEYQLRLRKQYVCPEGGGLADRQVRADASTARLGRRYARDTGECACGQHGRARRAAKH